jgi:class 3 adenylate cyclase
MIRSPAVDAQARLYIVGTKLAVGRLASAIPVRRSRRDTTNKTRENALHRGRIVKNTGDGFLAEFASVVDAVRWAAEIQRGMIDREPEAPEKRRIRFRIGINLGDVIAEEYDIFGDGVNVAA